MQNRFKMKKMKQNQIKYAEATSTNQSSATVLMNGKLSKKLAISTKLQTQNESFVLMWQNFIELRHQHIYASVLQRFLFKEKQKMEEKEKEEKEYKCNSMMWNTH